MKRGIQLSCAVFLAMFWTLNASAIVYVDKAQGGPEDGTSWATAYDTIQEGIDSAVALGAGAANAVWVKAGNYNENRTEAWGNPASVAGSLVLKANVKVYGGFDGTETLLSQRGVRRAITTIDGSTARGGSAAYHVVVCGNQASSVDGALLDGFDIVGGNAAGVAGDYHTYRGGGIYVWRSSPTIANCTIHGNTAAVSGGGASNESWIDGGDPANGRYENCVFWNNVANRIADTFTPTFDFPYDPPGLGAAPNPIRGGGAMFNNHNATPTIIYCTFDINNTGNPGYVQWGAASAGLYQWLSAPTVNSCILWADNPGEIQNDNPLGFASTAAVSYSDIQGGYPPGPGPGNINANPAWVAPGPEFWLTAGSPCVNTGDVANPAPNRDLPGVTRPVGGRVDMGAYEYCPTGPAAVCQPHTVVLDDTGNASMVVGDIDGGSTAPCGLYRLVASQTTFNVGDIPSVSVTLTVTDILGQTSQCNATVTVNCTLPVINDIPSANPLDGTNYTSPVPSLSQGTPPFTWLLISPSPPPANFNFSSVTGQVSWTPVAFADSPVNVRIRATGPCGDTDDELWTITVDAIDPVINGIGPASVNDGDNYTGPTPSLSQGTTPINWALVAPSPPPANFIINATTGVVTWTPADYGAALLVAPLASNNVAITIRAEGPQYPGDPNNYDNEDWTLTVVPLLPVIDPIGDLTVTDQQNYTETPSLAQGTTPIVWTLDAPVGLANFSINAGTGVVTWTPADYADALTVAPNGAPQVDVTIRATGPSGFDTEAWRITVDAIPPVINDIPDANPQDGSAYDSGAPTFANPQPTLPITWTLVAPAAPPANFSMAANGQVTWNPVDYQDGPVINVTIRAEGPDGDTDDEDWVITVDAIAPVINPIADLNVNDLSTYTETPTLSQGTLPIAWTLEAPAVPPANFSINASTGVVTWDPVDYHDGPTVDVTIRATGPDLDWDEEDWTITVDPVAPVIDPIADTTVIHNDPYQEDPTATGTRYATGFFAWSLVAGPPGMTVNANTGQVNWTADEAEDPASVTIQAQGPGGIDTEIWIVNIDPIPVPPVFDPIADQDVNDRGAYSFTPTLSAGTAPLTFALLAPSPAPGDMAINASTGLVTWTADYAQALTVAPLGTPDVDFTLDVGNPTYPNNDQESYTLTVHAIPPVINDIPDANPPDGSAYDSGAPTFANPQPTLPITWTLVAPAAPPANFSIAANGQVTWNPVDYQDGPVVNVLIQAQGPDGDTDTEDWVITVDAIPPVIDPIGPANPADGTTYTETPTLAQGTLPMVWTLEAPGSPPANFGINASTGVVTWDPVDYQAGPVVNVNIRATGPDSDWDEEPWTITVDAVAPDIQDVSDGVVPDGQNYDSGAPTCTGTTPFTWSLVTPSPAPANMQIAADGTVTWTPANYQDALNYAPLTQPIVNVVIQAEGPDHDTDTEDWTITVDAIHPVIAPIDDEVVVDGNAYSKTPSLTAGTLPITWSLVTPGTPPGDMAIDAGTGEVTWTANYAQADALAPIGDPNFMITIRATGPDNDTDDEDWVLTVDAIPPVIDPAWTPTATVTDGQAYSSTVPSLTQGTPPIAWSLLAPDPAPGDMACDAGTGEVTWTADYADGPVVSVTLQAEGPDGDQDTRSWTITVIPVPPIINPIADDTVVDGQVYTCVLPDPLLAQGTVPVTYSLTAPSPSLPGMSIAGSTGVVTWNTADYAAAWNADPVDSPDVTLTMEAEGPESNTDDETWTLTVDAAPPVIDPISNTNVMDGTAYVETPSATGTTDPTTGFFVWTLVAPSPAPGDMAINADTGQVTWTAEYTDGVTPVTITIQAEGPEFDTDQETWDVLVYAEPPVIAEIPTRWAVDGDPYSETPSATGTQPFAWSLIAPDPAPGDMAIDAGTGEVTWTADIGESPLDLEIEVQGPDGDTDTEYWQLYVTETAEAPVINPIGAKLVTDGDSYSEIPVLSQGTGPFVWVLVSPSPAPGDMAINASTGQVTWTADYAAGPLLDMEISCTNFVDTDSEDWTLTVDAIPPVIDAMPDANPVDGTTYVSGAPTLSQGTPPIAWTLTAPDPALSGMSVDPSTGVLTWDPVDYQAGPVVNVTIQAEGPDNDVDDTSFTITVDAVPPQIDDIGNAAVFDGNIYSSGVPTLLQGTEPFTWTLLQPDPAPANMGIDAGTGEVIWSPSNYADGPVVNIQIQAEGPDADVDTESWQLSIIPVAPDIDPISDTHVDDQATYTETPTLSQGTAPITWSLLAPSPAPANMGIDPGTGVVTWDPAKYDDGPVVSISIRAQGPVGQDTESWDVTVDPLVPVIEEIDDTQVVTGTFYDMTPNLLQGSGTIVWSLEAPAVPPGDMDINPVTGRVTWTADIAESPVDMTIQAAGPLEKDTEDWVITVVPVPVAPIIEDVADHMTVDALAYSFTPTLTQGTLPVTWTLLAPDPPVGDMAIDAATGEVTWTADILESPVAITVQAENIVGTDDESWQLTVVEPLAFVTQPSGEVERKVGEEVTFEVEVTGGYGVNHYQWYKDGSPLLTAPDDPVLTIAAVVMEDDGNYSCYVWDDSGAIMSTEVHLIVSLGIPAAGLAGMVLLAGLAVAVGVGAIRRRRK